ncbi:MAG: hypothetical protein QW687_02135 [Candidatus Hadarchaeales archaeon]
MRRRDGKKEDRKLVRETPLEVLTPLEFGERSCVGDFRLEVYRLWRDVVDKGKIPKLVTGHGGEGLFDPLTSFIVSHLRDPVCISYTFPLEFSDVVVDVLLNGWMGEVEVIVPHVDPPLHGRRPSSGEYCSLSPYPFCFSFIEGSKLDVGIYSDRDRIEELKERFEDGIRRSVLGRVYLGIGFKGGKWVDDVDIPPFGELVGNYPSEFEKELRVVEDLVVKGLKGETRRGVVIFFLGSSGVGKTYLSLSLLRKVKEVNGVGLYLPFGGLGDRIYELVEEMKRFFGGVPTFVVLDDADPLLLSRVKYRNLGVLSFFKLIDGLPPGYSLIVNSNLVKDVDLSLVRPLRVDYLLVFPSVGYGSKVLEYVVRVRGDVDGVFGKVLEDESMKKGVDNLTVAEVVQLYEVIDRLRSVYGSVSLNDVKLVMKSVVRWRRIYREQLVEEV